MWNRGKKGNGTSPKIPSLFFPPLGEKQNIVYWNLREFLEGLHKILDGFRQMDFIKFIFRKNCGLLKFYF